MKFIKDAFRELSHVVWPTKKESRNYMFHVVTIITIMTVILAIFGTIFKESLYFAKNTIKPATTSELSLDDISNIINNPTETTSATENSETTVVREENTANVETPTNTENSDNTQAENENTPTEGEISVQ